eukprot:574844-Amphidinium_carterae.1
MSDKELMCKGSSPRSFFGDFLLILLTQPIDSFPCLPLLERQTNHANTLLENSRAELRTQFLASRRIAPDSALKRTKLNTTV